MRLDGRIVIVTGASSGFGRATAIRVAEEGASVVIADLDEAVVVTPLYSSRRPGATPRSSWATWRPSPASGRWWRRRWPGSGPPTSSSTTPASRRGCSKTPGTRPRRSGTGSSGSTSRACTCCSRAVIPMMLAKGRGSIVNVASIAATRSVGGSPYAAAKAGILGYTRHVAAELAARGVRMNCVSPGFMRTPMTTGERLGLDDAAQQERLAAMGRRVPMQRTGTTQDIAAAIAYLASDDAVYVTGQEIVVDGGYLVG